MAVLSAAARLVNELELPLQVAEVVERVRAEPGVADARAIELG